MIQRIAKIEKIEAKGKVRNNVLKKEKKKFNTLYSKKKALPHSQNFI